MRTILQIYGGSPKKRGSLEDYFLRLALQLRQEGFASVFVFNREPEPHLAKLYREVGAEIVTVVDAGMQLDPTAVRNLWRLLREFRPSLVNFHFGSECSNGLVAARLAGIHNTVWTKHSLYANGPFYRKVPLLRLLTSMILFNGLLAKRVIAVSAGVAKELRCYHLPESKISRIYLGVNLERFSGTTGYSSPPRDLAIAEGERIVSCISQARPEKGLEYLIGALPQIISKVAAFRLLIVGGGPLTENLQRLARDLGVAAHITFCGVRDDVERIIAASEFTILPSLTEAQGLVILESFASGKPVVASNVGGIPEIVTDRVDGLLVPPMDVDALARQIAMLLQDKDMRRGMGMAAAEKAKEFDITAGVAGTVELYRNMTNPYV